MSFLLGFADEIVKLAQPSNPFGKQTAASVGIPGAGTQKSLGIPGASPMANRPAPKPASGAPTGGGVRNPGLRSQMQFNRRLQGARKELTGTQAPRAPRQQPSQPASAPTKPAGQAPAQAPAPAESDAGRKARRARTAQSLGIPAKPSPF